MPNFLLSSTAFRMLACAVAVATAPLLAPAAQAQSDAAKPVAIVGVTGYDALVSDIDYLGQFGGQVGAGKQLDNMLQLFTQDKGLQGVDKTKAWGVIVHVDGAVVCLPVTDLDAVLGLVEGFGMTTSEMGDGITEIEMPNQSMYVKKSGNWAFASAKPEMLDNAPADPGDMFDKMTTDYDIAAQVMVQNVPEMFRMIAIQQLRAGAEQGLQQNPGESDEAYQARRESTEASIDQIEQFINDLDELTVGFNTDADKGNVILDFTYSAVPDTQLAQGIEVYKDAKTLFAGCLKDGAAVTFNASVTTPADLLDDYKAQMEGQMASMRQQAMNGIDQKLGDLNEEARATLKEAVNDLLDALEATAMSGKMDMAGHVAVQDGKLTAVTGGYTKEPGKVEASLKKLSALLSDGPEVQWNADSHGDAKIHTLLIPINNPDEQALFGESLEVAVGIGPEQFYVTAGPGAVSMLKEAMDTSGSSATPITPVQFSLALTPILELIAKVEPNPAADAMLNAVVTKSEGMDSVHITAINIDGKLRTRLELEKGVLHAIGAAVMEARRQGAGAGF